MSKKKVIDSGTAKEFAENIMARAEKAAKEIEENREEILRAFVAKYNFDPDHAMQIIGKTEDGHAQSWHIIYISDRHIDEVRKLHLLARISKEPLNLWQKVCLFAATGRWQS